MITAMIVEMKLKDKLSDFIEVSFRFSQIFRKYPLCHSRPDRSLCYRERYFGLCARCTFMYLGGFLTILSFPVWNKLLSHNAWLLVGLGAIIPAGIDGTTQMFLKRESTNRLRAITGLSLGIGITVIMWAVVQLSQSVL